MPEETLRVLMTQRVPEVAIERLRQAAGDDGTLDINPDPDRIWTKQELIDRLRAGEYNALYCLLTNPVDAEVLDAAPRLKVVANMAVGYNNIQVEEATKRGIAVTNTPGVLTDTTADFTWTLLMASARRVVEADKFLRAGRFYGWGPLMMVGQDVYGKTLGVIGFGRIGRAVAKRATGFDMQVLYFDRHPADVETEKALNARAASMEELLRESDYVTIHTDYNPETHHLIGKPELESMKPTAYLINTARGPIVDEAALAEALKNGTIAGAGLDVFEREPEVHPGLMELDNAVLAPHIASASLDTRNAMALMAAENVIAALKGEMPPNCVNPEVFRRD
ncbi:MAG: D-glycerate dehydrogenase [Chloroflexota bacterium]|nr:D-glycerate dehydrogenase [Chloroflexota bacterium]